MILRLSPRTGWVGLLALATCLSIFVRPSHVSFQNGRRGSDNPVVPGVSSPTPTPFQPLLATTTPQEDFFPAATFTPRPSVTPVLAPSFQFDGIDFQDSSRPVSIEIAPAGPEVNAGNPITITFKPGTKCKFGDHYACISASRPSRKGDITFVTIHSGVGGEGQGFRNAIEGTWIDRAALQLPEVYQNMDLLSGAQVTIRQGDRIVKDNRLTSLGRVPAEKVSSYFRMPIQTGLALAVNSSGNLGPFARSDQPTLVIETCGWRILEEPWAEGVSWTTGSVYLGVIQKQP